MFFKSSFAAILMSMSVMSTVNGAAVSARGSLDIFSPPIITPNAQTVWKIGQVETVTWDPSGAPVNISNGSGVFLSGVGFLIQGFDLRSGSVQVTVPDVTPGTYHIALFGDSGNISPDFQIVA